MARIEQTLSTPRTQGRQSHKHRNGNHDVLLGAARGPDSVLYLLLQT
jgi:hypothetical protein